jgi:hypothetical protein
MSRWRFHRDVPDEVVQRDEEYFVVAVAHLKRRPRYWLERLATE